jgi:hypothetical protein
LQSGTNPGLGGLTEFYFKGVSAGSQLDYQLNTPSIESRQAGSRSLEPVSAAPANISYQARCAERWWDEFRRWFGTQE